MPQTNKSQQQNKSKSIDKTSKQKRLIIEHAALLLHLISTLQIIDKFLATIKNKVSIIYLQLFDKYCISITHR